MSSPKVLSISTPEVPTSTHEVPARGTSRVGQVKKGYLLIFDEAEPALGWRLVWASLRGPLLYYASGKFADVQVRLRPLKRACVARLPSGPLG